MHPPGTYETRLILSLGPIPTWKVDATITKLGWTTYMTPFSKWPPAKWNYVFVYNSASRIDRNNMFPSNEVRSWSLASSHLPTATWAGIMSGRLNPSPFSQKPRCVILYRLGSYMDKLNDQKCNIGRNCLLDDPCAAPHTCTLGFSPRFSDAMR